MGSEMCIRDRTTSVESVAAAQVDHVPVHHLDAAKQVTYGDRGIAGFVVLNGFCVSVEFAGLGCLLPRDDHGGLPCAVRQPVNQTWIIFNSGSVHTDNHETDDLAIGEERSHPLDFARSGSQEFPVLQTDDVANVRRNLVR